MLPCIVGWSHSKFGKLPDETVESLIVSAAQGACEHAGLGLEEIDQVFIGTFNPGLEAQNFPAPLALQADEALRFKPTTRVENACATGSAAIHQACNALAAGQARIVLVIGVEKMTGKSNAEVGDALLGASYLKETDGLAGGFAGVFGQIAERYFQRHGDKSAALARIAAKNHANAVDNPLAHMRKNLGFDFCNTAGESNPIVAGPLRRTDCALITDGAAALVLTGADTALTFRHAVAVRARAQATDFLPLFRRAEVTRFEGAARAWAAAQSAAKVGNSDLNLIELHDCFTISELIQYEALGLVPEGMGAEAIESGMTERTGALPVNPSGGLKARGHPIGATGVSMHVEVARQLVGQAGAMQIKDAALGGVFNMGGVAVANYASILEPLRA